jgi:hypothetical protein
MLCPGIYEDVSVLWGPQVRHHESGRGDLWADLVRNDFYRRVAEDAEDWLFYLAVRGRQIKTALSNPKPYVLHAVAMRVEPRSVPAGESL